MHQRHKSYRIFLICLACDLWAFSYYVPVAYAGENLVYPGMPTKSDPLRPGSYTLHPSASTDNILTVNAPFVGRIYGGLAQGNGNAHSNTVNIQGNITGNVHGGYVRGNGNAYNNHLTIGTSVTVNTTAEAIEYQGISGGHTFGNFQAYDNTIDIYGAVITGPSGVVAGGYSRGNSNVYGNVMTIHPGANVQGTLYGGYNLSDSASPSGIVSNNTVIIRGGAITGNVYGGHSDASGLGVSSEADKNSVIIYGGNITGDIYGGHSDNSSSDENEIYLSGATINGKIIGGETGVNFGAALGSARNNKITIVGGTGLNLANAFLYGNTPYTNVDSWRTDGNTLVIDRFRQSVDGDVFDVANFQNYHFIMHADMASGDTFLNITNINNPVPNTTTDIGGAAITVNAPSINRVIQPGSELYVFKTNGNDLLAGNPASIEVTQGFSLEAEIEIEQTPDYLRLFIRGVHIDPDTEDQLDGHIAGVILLNQGASLVASRGMRAIWDFDCNEHGWTPFSAFAGGSIRQNSGNAERLDVNGYSLMTGFANKTATSWGAASLGAFFETGWGDYDSENPMNRSGELSGSGNLNYYGVGMLGRIASAGGVYTEGSARFGRQESDYTSAGARLTDGYNNQASFTSKSNYWGAHFGLGYEWRISENAALDTASKYLWTHLTSDNVNVGDDPVEFNAVNSRRWNTGARLSYTVTPGVASYAGAAYEFEFSGSATGEAYGYRIPSSSMRGGTGIGELGVSFTPEFCEGLYVDLGVQAYTGTNEGFGGATHVKYAF